ncbi:MAG: hypothetical protein EXX96DRAFT_449882, partial [Benjaminiella poitrasii]
YGNIAEFLLSAGFKPQLRTTGIKLPSFEEPFYGYPSLSSDRKLARMSLSVLP